MRRTRCSSRMVIAATVAAMTLAACGGDDEPGTGATTVTTEPSSEPSGPPPTSSEPGTTKPSPSDPTGTTKLGPPASLPAPTSSPASPPASDSTAPTSTAGDDPALAAAVDEVARRRGVGTDAVFVAVDERVTWRDGSIGCPEPGKLYTQALVPGRRVVLRVQGRDFTYHAARSQALRYCSHPSADGTSPGGGDT